MLPPRPEAARRCRACAALLPGGDEFCRYCGYAQPDGGAPPRAVDRSVLLPTRPGSMYGFALAGVSIGVVLVLAVTTLGVREVFFAPADVVRSYFAALTDRDAEAAQSMLDGDGRVPRGGLLADSTLDSQGYHPPTGVTVERVTRDGSDAVAEVTFEVEGVSQRLTVGLNHGRNGVLRRWQIDDGLYPLQVTGVGGADLLFAGVPVPPDQPGGALGFPGGYDLALSDHPLFELRPMTVLAGGEPAAPSFAVHDRAIGVIEEQVRAYLDGCVTSPELAPPGCPFAASTGGFFSEYIDVSWSMINYPAVEYELQESGALYVFGSGGLAHVTATATSAFDEDVDEDVEVSIGGWVTVEGGEIFFEPDASFD